MLEDNLDRHPNFDLFNRRADDVAEDMGPFGQLDYGNDVRDLERLASQGLTNNDKSVNGAAPLGSHPLVVR